MKRSRYSDEQIADALRQAESGTAVADLTLDKHIGASLSRACELSRLSRALYYYRSRRRDPTGLRLRVRRRKHVSLHRGMPPAAKPVTITVDHGTEFTSRAMDEWAYRRGVKLDFIRPGKPV